MIAYLAVVKEYQEKWPVDLSLCAEPSFCIRQRAALASAGALLRRGMPHLVYFGPTSLEEIDEILRTRYDLSLDDVTLIPLDWIRRDT